MSVLSWMLVTSAPCVNLSSFMSLFPLKSPSARPLFVVTDCKGKERQINFTESIKAGAGARAVAVAVAGAVAGAGARAGAGAGPIVVTWRNP